MDLDKIDKFISLLDEQKFKSNLIKAQYSLHILEHILNTSKWDNISDVLGNIQNLSSLLKVKVPNEMIPRNIAIRIHKLIYDEKENMSSDCTDFSSINNNVDEIIRELKTEYSEYQEIISNLFESKIYKNEVILTIGHWPEVAEFLLKAAKAKNHKFHAIVAFSETDDDSSKTAKLLSDAGIQTTLIEDTQLFRFIGRVNRVILGCKAVYIDGSLTGNYGIRKVCAAAKYHSVPVNVCCPTYKFSVIPMDIESESIDVRTTDSTGDIAMYDNVSPEHIESYLTNEKVITPEQVHRHMKKMYFSVSNKPFLKVSFDEF